MGMMARMRSLAPWFILLVGGLFVLFMILSDTSVMEIVGRGSNQNVGSVDGEDITYQDFSNYVERARKSQEQSTGQSIDESQMGYFRDQVWDALVTQKLVDKKVKQYGIVVTNDEIRNAILGPNPPAFLQQQFTDSTGTFNRQLYEQTILDPQNKEIMLSVEDQIREQLVQQKLQNFLSASIIVSDQDVRNRFILQSVKMNADYIMIDPYTLSGEFKPTDEDLKNYYDNNLQDYAVEPSRKIKYVLFKKQASKGDSVGIKNNLISIISKMQGDTASFKSFAEIYSEVPYSKDTVGMNQVPPEAKDSIADAQVGSIIGPVATSQGYIVYKLDAKIKSKDEYVRASHILIKSTSDADADKKKADEIYQELRNGADFAKLASEKSDDGTKANGGDLGWFGKGQMVKEFEEACFNGKIGVIQKPIKTVFGWHIIKVTGKSNDKYVVEKIVNKITPSGTTIDQLYQDAQDFAYVAKENGFESEAQTMRYSAIETPEFVADANSIPGLGATSSIVKWAFNNGTGDISDVFSVNAGYCVVLVSDVIKAGFKPFDEVKEVVRNAVTRKMKFNKAMSIAEDIRSRIGDNGDLNVAKTVYEQAKIDSVKDFNTSGTIPTIGRDYTFSEYAADADLNKWSEPIKGARGAYLIKVTERTKFDDAKYEMQKSSIRNEILQLKKNQYVSQWIQALKKEADIVDNRYLFYR